MPEEPSLILLAISLIFLLILSAFFSGSETGMMASNKIKLRNKVKKGSKAAKRRASFCARMKGMPGPMKKPSGKPTRKALALKKWRCR